MKFSILAIVFILTSFNLLAMNNDGWTSSGGEYIIDQNNPWFMGRKPVLWCLDHGGADKFSLPIEEAKVEIERAIENLTTQLKSINRHNSDSFDFIKGEVKKRKQCMYTQEGCINMSDTFIFTSDCKNADIEIILGNYNNGKVKNFINAIGIDKFKKIAGIAVRTQYSTIDFRAKGFIYIAADLGEIQYSGARNVEFKSNKIWDYYKNLNFNAPVPENMQSNYKIPSMIHNLILKNYSYGALTSVISHEIGHVLGFGHNHYNNIMDEDYPANIVQTGITFKGNYLRDSKIFSRGLIESDLSRRIGYEWSYSKINNKYLKEIQSKSDSLYNLLFKYSEITNLKENSNIFFIFEQTNAYLGPQQEGRLRIATIDENRFSYKVLAEYPIKLNQNCQSEDSFIEKINFRSEVNNQGTSELIYDEQLNKWINPSNVTYSTVTSIPLLSFANKIECGEIQMNENKEDNLSFTLFQTYFSERPRLAITDQAKHPSYSINLTLSDMDILSPLDIHDPNINNLPPLSPVFYFSK